MSLILSMAGLVGVLALIGWMAFGRRVAGRLGAVPDCTARPIVTGASSILVWAALRRHAPPGACVLPRVPLDAIVGGAGGKRQRSAVAAFAAGHRADFVVVDGTTGRPLHVVQVVQADRDGRRIPPDAAVRTLCERARIPLLQLEMGAVDWESGIRSAFGTDPTLAAAGARRGRAGGAKRVRPGLAAR